VPDLGLRDWVLPKIDKELSEAISHKWQLPEFLVYMLLGRGFKTEEDANEFLNGSNKFPDPFHFENMKILVENLQESIEKFEKICIYGDYDADGITSTVMMYEYLQERGADVIYQIPSRYSEGYGLTISAIDKMHDYGVKTILTVDNGMSAHEEVNYANSLGIKVLVTDHHLPGEIPPAARSIVNPHFNKGKSFKFYAGVGVAFKVIEAMEKGEKTWEELMDRFGDLVAIGTIGDAVPLLKENREFVRKGIEILKNSKRIGLREILKNVDKIDELFITCNIVPKINACGRIGNPELAAKLLLCENESETSEIYEFITNENEKRKIICKETNEDVQKKIRDNPEMYFKRVIFAQSESWNHGVLGIVASRIISKFGKPVILFSIEEGEARGSARSTQGFSIFDAIEQCSEFLERYGGHKMAVGMNLKSENIEPFKKRFFEYIEKIQIPHPVINIERVLEPEEITADNVENLERIRPFGTENFEPMFGIFEVKLINIVPIGGGKHLKLMFSKKGRNFSAVYFGVSAQKFFYVVGDILDLAVKIRFNFYAGNRDIGIYISKIKFSSFDAGKAVLEKQIFEDFMNGSEIDDESRHNMRPTREEIASVYKFLKKNCITVSKLEVLIKRINKENINFSKLCIVFEIINELGLVDITKNADVYEFSINNVSSKVDLERSSILRKLGDKP
jgi:single-stranded-DNA-specific exonuclease